MFASVPEGDRHKYCRSWSPAREQLEIALVESYGQSPSFFSALVFPSGMAAIGAVMYTALTRPADGHAPAVLIHGSELYDDVPRTANHLEETLTPRVQVLSVDIRDLATLRAVFAEYRERISMFHLEACTNPSGQVFDFSVLAELKLLSPDMLVVCDNTWLSSTLFNPFEHGCDIVVESLTKYVSGGCCIGGAAIGPDGIVARLLTYVKVFGVYVGADHCELFLDGLSSLPARVAVASQVASRAAWQLEQDPRVSRVMYPTLPSHPTHDSAARFLRGGPGCVWFHVRGADRAAVDRAMANTDNIECKTSFGGKAARFDPSTVADRSGAYDVGWRAEVGEEGTWIRLALGYEQDAHLVLMALEAFLEACGSG